VKGSWLGFGKEVAAGLAEGDRLLASFQAAAAFWRTSHREIVVLQMTPQ
jgi:hypothetical protein